MPLRPYQQKAVTDCYNAMRRSDKNQCIVIPTAGGKSWVIAQIVSDVIAAGGRVVVVTHTRELVQQDADKLVQHEPSLADRVGIYSAGLKSRDTDKPVVFAGIQSAYKRAKEFGDIALIIIDEAHRIPASGDGMYQRFLGDFDNARLIGLTATPYRTSSGWICSDTNILNEVCHETTVMELIDDGYITRPVSYGMLATPDLQNVKIRGGEFRQDQLQEVVDLEELVAAAVREMVQFASERKSVLVFAAGIDHGEHIIECLHNNGQAAVGVFGHTKTDLRDEYLDRFQKREIKYLVNVDVLTTGFDAPVVDCIAMLRPTLSPGLYYQMIGRGFRLYEGKEDCMILDFAGNTLRHGTVDAIIPKGGRESRNKVLAKECKACQAINKLSAEECEACGAPFEKQPRVPKHEKKPVGAPVVGKSVLQPITLDVREVEYEIHRKKEKVNGRWVEKENGPAMLKVTYFCGVMSRITEYVLIEHTGYAYEKAAMWWHRRTDEIMPKTAEEAIKKSYLLKEPIRITYIPGDKSSPEADKRFDRIRRYEFE